MSRQTDLWTVVAAEAAPSRMRKWRAILEDYRQAPDRFAAQGSRSNARHAVISVGRRPSTLASRFAAAAGRPFVRVANVDAIPGLRSFDSLFIVSDTASLTGAALLELNAACTIPWGLATATDEAGLAFALIKSRVASGVRWPSCLAIDTYASSARSITGKVWRESVYADVTRPPTRHVWDCLGLLAHGEPGHTKLSGTVLCGVLGGVERDARGAAIDGCRVVRGRHVCKRAVAPDEPMAYGDVRARLVVLLACGGFSLGQDLYLSNLSSVLSIAEGFPAAFVAPVGNVRPSAADLQIAVALAAQGAGPWAACSVLNEAYQVHSPIRPYVLFGDPSARSAEASESALVDISRPRHSTRAIIEARSGSTSLPVVRGLRSIAVLRPGQTQAVPRISLTDRTRDLARLRRFALISARHLARCAAIEDAMRHATLRVGLVVAGGDVALARMTEARDATVRMVRWLLASIARASTRRTWDAACEEAVEPIRTGLAVWSAAAAALYRGGLWRAEPSRLLADTAANLEGTVSTKPRCPMSARHWLVTFALRDHLDGTRLRRIECSMCGLAELSTCQARKLRLNCPELTPGGNVHLTASLGRTQITGRHASVAMVLVEKVTGRVLFEFDGPAWNGKRHFSVPLPRDLVPEAHTLSAVVFEDADWNYQAIRVQSSRHRDRARRHG